MPKPRLTDEQRNERRLAKNAWLREQYANNPEIRIKKKEKYQQRKEAAKAYSKERYYSRCKEMEELRKKVKELEAKAAQ